MQDLKRLPECICLFFSVVLVLLALFFWKERAGYMDVAFQTFEMARSGVPAIQVYRFGALMTQIFPLLAIWLKAPLAVVGMSYSAGVVLYQLLLFAYLWLRVRRPAWILIYLITLCTLTSHMFFWIQSEFSQSLPFLIVLLARLSGGGSGWRYHGLNALMVGTLVFFHPLSYPVWVLCALLLYVSAESKIALQPMGAWLLWGAFLYGVKRYGFDNWYDHEASGRVGRIWEALPNMGTQSMKQFFDLSYSLYAGIWVLLAALLYLVWRDRRWFLGVLTLSVLSGYFILIHGSHPVAEPFYLENFCLAMPVLIAIPLVFTRGGDVVPAGLWAMGGLLALGFLFRVSLLGGDYKARQDHYRQLINVYGGQKVILSEQQCKDLPYIMSWPSAYEIWFLSQIEQGKTAQVFISDDPGKYREYLQKRSAFFGLQIYPYRELPKRYFSLNDTMQAYHTLSDGEVRKLLTHQ